MLTSQVLRRGSVYHQLFLPEYGELVMLDGTKEGMVLERNFAYALPKHPRSVHHRPMHLFMSVWSILSKNYTLHTQLMCTRILKFHTLPRGLQCFCISESCGHWLASNSGRGQIECHKLIYIIFSLGYSLVVEDSAWLLGIFVWTAPLCIILRSRYARSLPTFATCRPHPTTSYPRILRKSKFLQLVPIQQVS